MGIKFLEYLQVGGVQVCGGEASTAGPEEEEVVGNVRGGVRRRKGSENV